MADASADNKMDRVNLGLMFGQVENKSLEQAPNNLFLIIQTLLWPDPSLTLGLEYIAGIIRFQFVKQLKPLNFLFRIGK